MSRSKDRRADANYNPEKSVNNTTRDPLKTQKSAKAKVNKSRDEILDKSMGKSDRKDQNTFLVSQGFGKGGSSSKERSFQGHLPQNEKKIPEVLKAEGFFREYVEVIRKDSKLLTIESEIVADCSKNWIRGYNQNKDRI